MTQDKQPFLPGMTQLESTRFDLTVRAIITWADSIMPNRTPADAIKKLSMEEVPELWDSLKRNGEIDPGEIADVLILALDICHMSDIDPLDAINEKMAINECREWEFEYGVLQHKEHVPMCLRCSGDHHVSDCDLLGEHYED